MQRQKVQGANVVYSGRKRNKDQISTSESEPYVSAIP